MAATRALFCILILAGVASAGSTTSGGPCVSVWYDDFANGLRVIADADRIITLGITSAQASDGQAIVIAIDPGCGGGGGTGAVSVHENSAPPNLAAPSMPLIA